MKSSVSERLNHFIKQKNLFETTNTVLLAVSGGVDSVVLAHLFSLNKFSFAIAHCNFGLRHVQSDLDENFVKKLASNLNVKFYVKRFETKLYAEQKKISTQMAARDLRYAWFFDLVQTHNFDFLATAHHAGDVIETTLINLTRGTGISGLKGITEKNNQLIRPLLFLTKNEIHDFAIENKISWREDASNFQTNYLRNKIRLELIPLLKTYNPAIENSLLHTSQLAAEAQIIIDEKIAKELPLYFNGNESIGTLNIIAFAECAYPKTLIFEICKKYHLPANFVDQILELVESQTGLSLEYDGINIIKDRSEILFIKNKKQDFKCVFWENENQLFSTNELTISATIENFSTLAISKDSAIANLDFEKISFPLAIRNWQDGDYFYPLGMSVKKKLSDFFIDAKISIHQKTIEWLVCNSNGDIVWIVGRRIDNRYRITANTKKILTLKRL